MALGLLAARGRVGDLPAGRKRRAPAARHRIAPDEDAMHGIRGVPVLHFVHHLVDPARDGQANTAAGVVGGTLHILRRLHARTVLEHDMEHLLGIRRRPQLQVGEPGAVVAQGVLAQADLLRRP